VVVATPAPGTQRPYPTRRSSDLSRHRARAGAARRRAPAASRPASPARTGCAAAPPAPRCRTGAARGPPRGGRSSPAARARHRTPARTARAAARGRGATPSRTRGPRPRGPGRAAPRPAWTATRSGAPRRDPWVAEPRRRCEHSRRPPGERARNRRPGVGGPGYPDPMTAPPAPDAAATAARARRLSELHAAPEILRVVNVWDVVSARTVLALPQTTALATA